MNVLVSYQPAGLDPQQQQIMAESWPAAVEGALDLCAAESHRLGLAVALVAVKIVGWQTAPAAAARTL